MSPTVNSTPTGQFSPGGEVGLVDQEPVAPVLDSSTSENGGTSPLELGAVLAMFVLLSGVLLWDWSR